LLRWAVVARPRQGGRDLPEEFTFKTSVTGFVARLEEGVTPPVEDQSERGWSASITGNGRGLTGVSHGLSVGGERQLSADTVEIRVTSSVQSGELELPRSTFVGAAED